MMIRALAVILLLASTILGATAFGLHGNLLPAVILFLFLLIWSLAIFRHWTWMNHLGLLIFWVITAWGTLINLQPSLILTGSFCLIAGWDLAEFSGRLDRVEADEGHQELITRHLLWLTITLTIAMGCSIVANYLELRIPLGWMALLVLLAALGLGRVVSHLMKST